MYVCKSSITEDRGGILNLYNSGETEFCPVMCHQVRAGRRMGLVPLSSQHEEGLFVLDVSQSSVLSRVTHSLYNVCHLDIRLFA